MKKLVLSLALSLLPPTGAAFAETTIDKFALGPGETRSLSLPMDEDVFIGFKHNLSHEQALKCVNNCITLTQPGVGSMYSMFGGGATWSPINGTIDLIVENMEEFPMEVEIYRE